MPGTRSRGHHYGLAVVLANPWGLLALLAIPIIIGLHFFRERRKVIRIGGLHLWDFARVNLPTGRRLDRIVRSLPLLFQILAALILAMLIAGFDLPNRLEVRHFTVLLDDSISMQAGTKSSTAAKAQEILKEWAAPNDRFTVIAAGERSRVIAGPFATRVELLDAVRGWNPESAACEMENAVNLASKFVAQSAKTLFITDFPDQARIYGEFLEVHSPAAPLPNAAIAFSDRFRIGLGKDRVLISVKAYSQEPLTTVLSVTGGDQSLYEKRLELAPGEVVNVSFETDRADQPLNISLSKDAFAPDNSALLLPLSLKTVGVFHEDFGEANAHMERAVQAVPFTKIVGSPAEAHLVFARASADTTATLSRFPAAFRTFVMGVSGETTAARVAQGREILLDRNNPFLEKLPLEGVIWPYSPAKPTRSETPILTHRGAPLWQLTSATGGRKVYRLNIDTEKTNLFRQTAWPVLVQSVVEETREAIPGLSRSNYRTGEEIAPNLKPDEKLPQKFRLLRNGTPVTEYDELPTLLDALPPGLYALDQNVEKPLAQFVVNFFSPGESNLTALAFREANLDGLQATHVGEASRNRLIYFLLTAAFIAFTALAWVYQDRSY